MISREEEEEKIPGRSQGKDEVCRFKLKKEVLLFNRDKFLVKQNVWTGIHQSRAPRLSPSSFPLTINETYTVYTHIVIIYDSQIPSTQDRDRLQESIRVNS